MGNTNIASIYINKSIVNESHLLLIKASTINIFEVKI